METRRECFYHIADKASTSSPSIELDPSKMVPAQRKLIVFVISCLIAIQLPFVATQGCGKLTNDIVLSGNICLEGVCINSTDFQNILVMTFIFIESEFYSLDRPLLKRTQLYRYILISGPY